MAGRRNSSLLGIGGIPRVQLLPPDVAAKRDERGRIRGLAALVGVSIVVVAVGYAFGALQSAAAQTALTDAQNQTVALTGQQSTYTTTKNTQDSIAQITEALKVGTSSEVLWSDLDATVQRHLPAGDQVVTATFTGRAPFDPVLPVASPLGTPKVATMAITLSIATPHDVNTFMESLSQEDTVSNVAFVGLVSTDGQHTADFRIDFDVRALSHRFPEEASK